MGFNRGISANVKLPPGNKSGGIEQLSQIMAKVKGGIQVGRVTDIILNSDYPDIDKYGGLNGIGTIFFELNNFISYLSFNRIYFFMEEFVLSIRLSKKSISFKAFKYSPRISWALSTGGTGK